MQAPPDPSFVPLVAMSDLLSKADIRQTCHMSARGQSQTSGGIIKTNHQTLEFLYPIYVRRSTTSRTNFFKGHHQQQSEADLDDGGLLDLRITPLSKLHRRGSALGQVAISPPE